MNITTKTTVEEAPNGFYDPFGGRGEILSRTADKVTWRAEVEPGVYACCTQTLVEPILEHNKQRLNDSEGKRWGDGKIVASIDLPTYYSTILPAIQAGDDAWVKRWLNDEDQRKYRTFRGRL